jgi:5-methylcytosine-specific restriction protein A
MPSKPPRPCSQPGCPELVRGRDGACAEHSKQRAAQRQNRGGSSYGRDWRERVQPRFIYRNPWCVLCGQRAQVADHWPISRRDLIARGERNPDAVTHLRPLCKACDAKERPKREPGGFLAERRSQREAEQRVQRGRFDDVPPF